MSLGMDKTNLHPILSDAAIQDLVTDYLADSIFNDRRVLVLIPDHTRTAPLPVLFRAVSDVLKARVKVLNFMVALGTHQPLDETALLKLVGLTPHEKETAYGTVGLLNHAWDNPLHLVRIGELNASQVEILSEGLLHESVTLRLNRQILEHDVVLILGPVFPHEVAGFSGGNKYFFPGIASAEFINASHWLGALKTNYATNGIQYTPVRAMIDQAASFIAIEKRCLAFVSSPEGLHGLFYGSPESAWEEAVPMSAQIHMKLLGRPYMEVLGVAHTHYDDLWTAGKVMYKLEPVVAAGGRLIIYAPQVDAISCTHDRWIRQVGYHVRDYFLNQMDRFTSIPRGVLAHSTHVRGTGTFENGVEKPRIQVVLATAVPEHQCRAVNLDYQNPNDINVATWQAQDPEKRLLVNPAGETLYRVKG
jgi:nickel-dependent lactate racemase